MFKEVIADLKKVKSKNFPYGPGGQTGQNGFSFVINMEDPVGREICHTGQSFWSALKYNRQFQISQENGKQCDLDWDRPKSSLARD